MEKYRMFIDRKVTIWERQKQEIEADSLEEAEKLFHENLQEGEVPSELIMESIDNLSVKENGGNPTEELFLELSVSTIQIGDNIGTDFSSVEFTLGKKRR